MQGFAASLAALEAAPGELDRVALLALLKTAFTEGQQQARLKLEESGSGLAAVNFYAGVADEIITGVFTLCQKRLGAVSALVATGGYGRRELAPYSDIDLLFLQPEDGRASTAAVEYMLYLLWDIGLKVGHAVRTVNECVEESLKDITIRTTLLEARLIAGDTRLYASFEKAYQERVVKGSGLAFVAAKLKEREQRHARFGDSRYMLEPNVKESVGGLRDLQTLFWITHYLYGIGTLGGLLQAQIITASEAQQVSAAQDFLWKVRCHLHLQAGRAEDRLTFDIQGDIAGRLGYGGQNANERGEIFMRDYFRMVRTIGTLTRIICAHIEGEFSTRITGVEEGALLPRPQDGALEGFVVRNGWLDISSEGQFENNPTEMLRLFHVAQEQKLDVAPAAWRSILRLLPAVTAEFQEDPAANRIFLSILTSRNNPELALRRLTDVGLLMQFLPDWGRVVALMQYDMYHVFTVEEHTLGAIGVLHKVDTGQLADSFPLATELMKKIASRRALYVAVLLHDICKGRQGDHSELGAALALQLGPRLGLEEEETETVSWLVRHHLFMSQIAFKRDVDDASTVPDFAGEVRSAERLRLLTILTTVDIFAVGPGRWTNWKSMLIDKLYHRTEQYLLGGFDVEQEGARVEQALQALREKLPDWPERVLAVHARRGSPAYWAAFSSEDLVWHARLMREADRRQQGLAIAIRTDARRSVTEVVVYTAQRRDLWPLLAGALAMGGANILEARLFDMKDGWSLAVFAVQDATGGPFDTGGRLERLESGMRRVLSGKFDLTDELVRRRPPPSRRTAVFAVAPRVRVDNAASRLLTVIEVNGQDRPGLLHDLTRALIDHDLHISSACISTYGNQVVDVFYIKNRFGLKVEHEAQLQVIRQVLLEVLKAA